MTDTINGLKSGGEDDRVQLINKIMSDNKIEDFKELEKKLKELNNEKKASNQKIEADQIAIKNQDEKLQKEILELEYKLKNQNDLNNKLNISIQTKQAQFEQHENQEKNIMDEIKINMKKLLDVRRYKKIRDELEKDRFNKRSSNGSAAVLVRYIETDIFSKENEQKAELNCDYKNQVFFVTENKKIEDIFYEALDFFELEDDEEHFDTGENEKKDESDKLMQETKGKKTADKNVKFNL